MYGFKPDKLFPEINQTRVTKLYILTQQIFSGWNFKTNYMPKSGKKNKDFFELLNIRNIRIYMQYLCCYENDNWIVKKNKFLFNLHQNYAFSWMQTVRKVAPFCPETKPSVKNLFSPRWHSLKGKLSMQFTDKNECVHHTIENSLKTIYNSLVCNKIK